MENEKQLFTQLIACTYVAAPMGSNSCVDGIEYLR